MDKSLVSCFFLRHSVYMYIYIFDIYSIDIAAEQAALVRCMCCEKMMMIGCSMKLRVPDQGPGEGLSERTVKHVSWIKRMPTRVVPDKRPLVRHVISRRVDHTTRHPRPLFKVKKSKVKVTSLRNVSAAKCYNLAVDGHINFNYHREVTRVIHFLGQ